MLKKIINWLKKLFKGHKYPTPSEFPKDLIWLGVDVSGWKITAKCPCTVKGNTIVLDSDKKSVWPKAGGIDGGVTNANAWIVLNYKGQNYAATWEWMAFGKNTKKLTGKLGSYIKRSSVIPYNWHPKSGEKIGLFVSGLCRDKTRNVSERSHVCWVTWP